LAAQFVAHSTAQMNVRDGDNINSGDDEFHRGRHTSEVNKLRPLPAKRSKGIVQRLNSKYRSRGCGLEALPSVGIKMKEGILATVCNQLLAFRCENLSAGAAKAPVRPQCPIV
jgi:hypothetical protein